MIASDTRLRTYLKAFWNDWLSRMCGPLSVPLGAMAVFWKNAPVKELWGVLAIVAFFVASYRVWRNERSVRLNEFENYQQTAQAEIAVLNEKNATLSSNLQSQATSLGVKRAELVLHPRGGSTYIVLQPTPQTTAPNRIYVELNLAIENKGNRTSNVVSFSFDAARTGFTEFTPNYPTNIQGRRSSWTLPGTGLGIGGHITVEVDGMVSGQLGFFISFVPMGDSFDGTLTVTDTEGNSASRDFYLTEHYFHSFVQSNSNLDMTRVASPADLLGVCYG